ncbi:MAG TPA: NAD(P)H-binding protein [Candidatus Nitrosopelagicus sp.]|nr:NAD(P)H-binding protein [Candidatus Nitrosopelagicus sp.]
MTKQEISTITITGANGFVAKNLRNFLSKNHIKVIAIARKTFQKHHTETAVYSKTLLEKGLQNKLRNCDALVHLIGIGKQSSKYNFEGNVDLTKNMIKTCKKSGIKKIIYISGLGVTKNSRSDYFISKYKAEQEIINSGLNYTIFRPSYIVGKKDYLSKFVLKQIKKGIVIIPGSGKYHLQPIFVEDVAKIILESISEKKFSNKILDLVGPEIIKFEDFVRYFVKNKKIRIQKINLESIYHEALHNPKSIYDLDSLNLLIGDYTGNLKQLQKISNVKLRPIKDIL